jgi:hypothetical protein
MAFVIHRIVGQNELLERPRVSHKISEYVFDFIDKNILSTNNIMQSNKFIYVLTLSFSFGIPTNHKIIYRSPYSTDKRLYVPMRGFRVFEKVTKNAHLTVVADDINQNIKPNDYAILVYRMFADYLLLNYKKLKKETFDNFEKQLDFSHIESFPFPAAYDDQKYMEWDNDISKQKYLRHYGQ